MFIHYTNSLSAHQLPLDKEIIKEIGSHNFLYIYTNELLQGGAQEIELNEDWIHKFDSYDSKLIEESDVLMIGGLRPIDLMERRLNAGKTTLYMSERWFKPIPILNERLWLPGWLRLLHPRYFIMAMRFAFLFKNNKYRYLPIGPHASRDMEFIIHIFYPFQKTQINRIIHSFIPWGDFVEKSKYDSAPQNKTTVFTVLYIGRLLKLKHVDDIINAVKLIPNAKLTIVGNGPDEFRLKKMANEQVTFCDAVSLTKVREVMRVHDVVVFASNSFDGWGAVVQEALTEGVPVFGTYEAGASAALLPDSQLFHCGDYKTLAKLLLEFSNTQKSNKPSSNHSKYVSSLPIDYTPWGAAKRLIEIIKTI